VHRWTGRPGTCAHAAKSGSRVLATSSYTDMRIQDSNVRPHFSPDRHHLTVIFSAPFRKQRSHVCLRSATSTSQRAPTCGDTTRSTSIVGRPCGRTSRRQMNLYYDITANICLRFLCVAICDEKPYAPVTAHHDGRSPFLVEGEQTQLFLVSFIDKYINMHLY
jgi:hypothetical protein